MYQLVCKDQVNSENNFTQEYEDRLAVLNEIARLYGREVVEDLMDAILECKEIGLDVVNYGKVQFQITNPFQLKRD